jgi:hypothetical protein
MLHNRYYAKRQSAYSPEFRDRLHDFQHITHCSALLVTLISKGAVYLLLEEQHTALNPENHVPFLIYGLIDMMYSSLERQ